MNQAPSSHIFIDATALQVSRGGVGRLVESFIEELARNSSLRITLIVKHGDPLVQINSSNISIIISPWWTRFTGLRFIWEQLGLPRIVDKSQATCLVSPHYTFPILKQKFARVVIIHDLTFFTLPQFHGNIKKLFFKTWIRIATQSDVQIVTPSQATSDELTSRFDILQEKVTVAQLGIDVNTFHPPSKTEIEHFQITHGIENKEWVAFLGTLEPRKNVGNLVTAVKEINTQSGKKISLLIAGAQGWDNELQKLIEDARESGSQILTLGYLPKDDLRKLLGGATVVCYPSYGEGFGLPVLEAMACGATVLTTKELSLSEVGGNAVAYTEVDSSAIRENLSLLLSSSKRRKEYSLKAMERSHLFSWRKMTERILFATRLAEQRLK